MERLVELSDQEVRIDFTLNSKCRANVRLRSLITATPVAFKVQTSSPHKFLVNPPCGLIPPLSYATFQVILKPQDQLPPTFPRSPSDRFLVITALASDFTHCSPDSIHHELISSWFSSRPRDSFTHDLKLKIAFVGPVLLFHAVANGDIDAVKNLIKRQKTVVAELQWKDAESLLRAATELENSDSMINLLTEGGLTIDAREQVGDTTELHEEAVIDQVDELASTMKSERGLLDCEDKGGRSHLGGDAARYKANDICQEQMEETQERGKKVLHAARRGDVKLLENLVQKGCDVNYRDQYGLAALHVASIKGHTDVVKMLITEDNIEMKDNEGHSPLHLAVEGGCSETVDMLITNGANVNAKTIRGAAPLYIARAMGYHHISDLLLSRGASALLSSFQ